MKRKHIYLLFFSSVFSLTITGCCDNDPQDYTFLDWNNIRDFRVQNVNSANFVNGKGGIQNFNSVVYKDEMIIADNCPKCCDRYQTLKVIYDGENNNYNFSINIKTKSASGGDGLSIYYIPKYTLNLIYHNEDIAYIENESLSRVLVDKNVYSELMDSIKINNNVFYNVFKFNAEVATTKLYPMELYYNKVLGIVGYLMSDSTFASALHKLYPKNSV